MLLLKRRTILAGELLLVGEYLEVSAYQFRNSLRQGVLNDVTAATHLVQMGGKPIPTKVEPIVIRSPDKTGIRGIAVSDNDDGLSDFLN